MLLDGKMRLETSTAPEGLKKVEKLVIVPPPKLVVYGKTLSPVDTKSVGNASPESRVEIAAVGVVLPWPLSSVELIDAEKDPKSVVTAKVGRISPVGGANAEEE